MSDISKMTDKQLRNEVQLLRDELAKMKRTYEDIIYNLDDGNFSSQFIKEKDDMKTKIEVTAEGIKTKVSKTDLETSLSNYSTIEQTAFEITSMVTKNFIRGKLGDTYTTPDTVYSMIDQEANSIMLSVIETYGELESRIASVSLTADSFETRVGNLEDGKYGDYTLFRQTADTFLFDGQYMKISSAIQLTDNYGNHSFSIFHNEGNGVSAGFRGTYICAAGNNLTDPLFIGSENQKVYLYDYGDENLIATRGWVLDNAGSGGGSGGVAVFG